MLKKIKNSFYWGLVIGIILSFIVSYLSWPKLPLDNDLISGTKIILPEAGSPAGFSYPQDGDKVSGIFLVYGAGQAFENQAIITLYDDHERPLYSQPVYFHSPDMGITGPFISLIDLTSIETESGKGVLVLYEEDSATGKKIIIDSVNLRFN